MKSIFSAAEDSIGQPVPNAAYYDVAFKSKAVLRVSSDGIAALRQAKPPLPEDTLTLLETNGFWEMIITSYSEAHEEGFIVMDVLSDTYVAYAMGAVPVKVTMSGFLFYTKDEDHRIDFIKIYDALFRGTRAQELGASITFSILGTTMDLKILSSSLAHSAGRDDMVNFSMAGIGLRYETTAVSVDEENPSSTDISIGNKIFGDWSVA